MWRWGEWYTLHVGVEEDELADIPGEAVSDTCLERLLESVVNQFGVEWVPALWGVGHFDFPSQHRFIGVTPIQAEIVTLLRFLRRVPRRRLGRTEDADWH